MTEHRISDLEITLFDVKFFKSVKVASHVRIGLVAVLAFLDIVEIDER